MALPNIEIRYPGQPCTHERIREIEQQLNRTLPKDYAEFIMATGGGVISLKNSIIRDLHHPTGDARETELEQIFGNGITSNDTENDLATYAQFLTDEWEIPDEVLLIGHAESGMHEYFALNYGITKFPKHSVLYFDGEGDSQFLLAAVTFTDFLNKLQPSPDYKERIQSPFDGQEGIHAALSGRLGNALSEAIKFSNEPDMENVLRKAAAKISEGNLIEMYVTEDSFRFQDLLFFLSEPFQDFDSLDSWKDFDPTAGKTFTLSGLVLDSFITSFGWSAVQFFDAAIIGWWNSRTEMRVLTKTSNGYKLRSDYVDWLIDTFR